MNKFFEKLLPPRFWKKPVLQNPDSFWEAFAATPNPQSEALLHVAQDKFIGHIQSAADTVATPEVRLRALDRAMAIVDYLQEVEGNFATAKDEIKRRASLKQEALER